MVDGEGGLVEGYDLVVGEAVQRAKREAVKQGSRSAWKGVSAARGGCPCRVLRMNLKEWQEHLEQPLH